MRARSRPSLTFGTHSTTGEAGPAAAAPGMRCILLGAMQFLPIGKLRAETLQAIFDKHPVRDPRVVVGPRVGEDAAVIDAGDRYLVATTDPITFATDEIGWYALQVNANDIAVRGARPRWFLATLLLPSETTTEASVTSLFAELYAACDELDVALVGGHTEITHGLDRPIVVGAMLGEVAKDKLVTTGGARVGDAVVLTKGVPLEGAAIIARAKEAELRRRGVPAPLIQRAKAFLRAPGLSVLPEVEIACELAEVHAMHDPTEGGIATALVELADAAGVGLRIDRDRIMVLPEGRTLCEAFGLDPLGTIASGALLMTLSPADASLLRQRRARGDAPQPVWSRRRPRLSLLRGGDPPRALPERQRPLRLARERRRARPSRAPAPAGDRPADGERAGLRARVGDAARALRHATARRVAGACDQCRRRLPDLRARESGHPRVHVRDAGCGVAAGLRTGRPRAGARRAVYPARARPDAPRPRRGRARPLLYG